jgi:hypothetical protein
MVEKEDSHYDNDSFSLNIIVHIKWRYNDNKSFKNGEFLFSKVFAFVNMKYAFFLSVL